ncbi:hypothetical protein CXG81DRAFT_28773 [Caulochytrium protostelioides]|uniref:Uncharacterized protein n=1 Tax=Caulochytrium protostelioides TaxID=1555241 RepID=A0A4P9WY88_9FUNG|nr:hypothetical protein CXG81DRAFT_28773 [Caulochytrium protostelioides]|eukprot:RKO98394.1 hypothetical protein CXG81DRAFT_28773 [Caulochytrium protostelioides]
MPALSTSDGSPMPNGAVSARRGNGHRQAKPSRPAPTSASSLTHLVGAAKAATMDRLLQLVAGVRGLVPRVLPPAYAAPVLDSMDTLAALLDRFPVLQVFVLTFGALGIVPAVLGAAVVGAWGAAMLAVFGGAAVLVQGAAMAVVGAIVALAMGLAGAGAFWAAGMWSAVMVAARLVARLRGQT